MSAFRDGLRERGYVEGHNLTIDFRLPVRSLEQDDPNLASDLVRNNVDLILAWTSPSVIAARRIAGAIPIVMVGIADPVGLGFVASLARPGGNVTGISNVARDLSAKLVELLHEIAPGIHSVGVLRISANPAFALQLQETQRAIGSLGLKFLEVTARTPEEFEEAFARLKVQGADAVSLSSNW